MESIHLKTVDPASQDLLRSAAKQGVDLNFERYERQQPQDGFLRLGLSCPYGCMEGPCRIDPFGRGANRGLCGLGRDGMVAALLLRLSLLGVLEKVSERVEGALSQKSWPPSLAKMGGRALKSLGNNPISLREIDLSASLLQRPETSPEGLIVQALRLGVLAVLLSYRTKTPGRGPKSLICRAGYGLVAEGEVSIGIVGKPARRLILSLEKETARLTGPSTTLISLGDWIPMNRSFLPLACTSGEAELLLSSGGIHLVLAGPKTDVSLLELCRELKIPLVMANEESKPSEILRLARKQHGAQSQKKFVVDPSQVGEGKVSMDPEDLRSSLKRGRSVKVAFLAGSDTLQLPMGWLPVDVATTLVGEGYRVVSWGDAALWTVKSGLASEEKKNPVVVVDEQQGPGMALQVFGASGDSNTLRGICFTGLKTCGELAMVLGLASLGFRVCVATPLPLWGSEEVRMVLRKKLAMAGGSLTHYDHPAEPREILEWFRRKEP
jgi:hypothetical protein